MLCEVRHAGQTTCCRRHWRRKSAPLPERSRNANGLAETMHRRKTMRPTMRVPWRDRQGRFLKFKAAVLACTPIPALVYAFWWIDGDLGARSVNAAIHGMGGWA